MNQNNKFSYFSTIVIGENPNDKICLFDEMLDVKEYVLYKHSEKKKLKLEKIKIYSELIKTTRDKIQRGFIQNKINELKNMSDDEYFSSLSVFGEINSDGDIISTENPNGKWISCEEGGKIFSNILIDINGNYITSAKKKDIDWDLIHFNKDRIELFNRTWELCVENKTPNNIKDETIKENFKNYPEYFKNFKSKDEYVNVNTCFWAHSVIYKDKWADAENKPQFEWMVNFYDRFIKNINDDELITIYECGK